jgi:hypothetical protein
MKNPFNRVILCLFITVLFSCSNLLNSNIKKDKKTEYIKNIKFVPNEFNNIKLDYYETCETPCSPNFPEGVPINTIAINTPQKIICYINKEGLVPIIPICAVYSISLRRGLKYDNLSAKMLHIRKVDEKTVYSGEIVDKNMQYEYPDFPPEYEEREKERLLKVEEAQKYSDDELDYPGGFGGNYMNINLLEYVDIPFQASKYEIYLSFSGLESNHTIVEVVTE